MKLEWQTYSCMAEAGIILGIGLYDGDDCTLDLQGSTVQTPEEADPIMKILNEACEKLNKE